MIVFLIVQMFGSFSVDADRVGAFQEPVVFLVEDGYLIVSRTGNLVSLVDLEGHVKARYAEAGEGPGELALPVYLGRHEGHYLFMNAMKKNVVALDKQLKPAARAYPPLPESFAQSVFLYGLQTSEGWFAVNSGMSRMSHQLIGLAFSDGWRVTGERFAQRWPEDVGEDFFKHIRNNWKIDVVDGRILRTNMTIPLEADTYEASLYTLDDRTPERVFRAPADGFKRSSNLSPIKGSMMGGFLFKDGYLLRFTGSEKSGRQPMFFADAFSKEGGFLRRVQGGEDLIPCVNCSDTFQLEEQDGREVMVIVPSLEAWLRRRFPKE